MNESQNPMHFKNVRIDQQESDRETYSPRKVAQAIGVSESSLKRWCDAGFLKAVKTAGGHRRISRGEVISFVKRKQIEISNPSVIGLPSFSDVRIQGLQDASAQLYESLVAPDEQRCRRLLTYLFIEGYELAAIFDRVVAPAFSRIGDGWSCGKVEVYEERRACQACLSALHYLKSILPGPDSSALRAIGGAIEHDHYVLPTTAVEMTLCSLGWQAESMGSNLPVESMLKAAEAIRPRLFWVSVSYLHDRDQVATQINFLANSLPAETMFVLGGSAIDEGMRSQLNNVVCCDNLSQLVASVRAIKPKPEPNFAGTNENQ